MRQRLKELLRIFLRTVGNMQPKESSKFNENSGILLLSGGIDSAVAAKIMIDKGLDLIGLHFSLEPFTNDSAKQKAIAIAEKVGINKVLVIQCGIEHAEIVKQCSHRFYYIISRRMMLKIAERIANNESASYIITGDNLGQVGSQTLSNMDVITKAIKLPIIRPLLTNDKNETIALAKEYGTYDLSIGPEMCSVLGPKNPATRSELGIIEKEESKVDMTKLITNQLEKIEVVEILNKPVPNSLQLP